MTEPNPDTAHEPQPGSPADAEEEAMADVELEEEEGELVVLLLPLHDVSLLSRNLASLTLPLH